MQRRSLKEDGVTSGPGALHGSFLDFAAPHMPAGDHILFFPAPLVSPGAAAGLSHGLGVGTYC